MSGPDLGSGPNLVMNSPKKSLQNKPKNIFFGQLPTKIWTKQLKFPKIVDVPE